jgi:TPP-dependent pyruvate/acetoin dehydrogenase alpha subunit
MKSSETILSANGREVTSFADVGDLADPSKHHEPIDIHGQDPAVLKAQLRMMLTIRMVEQHLALKRKEGLIGGPVHLGVGQEAIAVGVSQWLRNSDKVFGGHRSHSHVLALGASIRGLFAEVLGKDTGLSRGMGGSMHLWDEPHGFFGSVPIVAGTVPLAVGAGLAAKLKRTTDIAVAYFGDGAVEEGAVHESLNLARMLNAPVLFVCENNFFSSHMHIKLRQPSNAMARFAAAHDIECEIVDGNDVVAVNKSAERLIGRARDGHGPAFLEAVTFRWYGHVDWREDIDVGVERSVTDLSNWRARDPVSRLTVAMERERFWSAADQTTVNEELSREIKMAWEQAVIDPYPDSGALLDRVYAPKAGY